MFENGSYLRRRKRFKLPKEAKEDSQVLAETAARLASTSTCSTTDSSTSQLTQQGNHSLYHQEHQSLGLTQRQLDFLNFTTSLTGLSQIPRGDHSSMIISDEGLDSSVRQGHSILGNEMRVVPKRPKPVGPKSFNIDSIIETSSSSEQRPSR